LFVETIAACTNILKFVYLSPSCNEKLFFKFKIKCKKLQPHLLVRSLLSADFHGEILKRSHGRVKRITTEESRNDRKRRGANDLVRE
jgi:hypothetical protein